MDTGKRVTVEEWIRHMFFLSLEFHQHEPTYPSEAFEVNAMVSWIWEDVRGRPEYKTVTENDIKEEVSKIIKEKENEVQES